jgi:hypothetical protein
MLIITDASMSMEWNEIKILHVRAISLFWDMLSFIWSRSLGFDGPSIHHKIPYVHNMRDMLNVGRILGNILCFFWLFEATLDLSKYYLIHLNPVTFTIATLLASFSVKATWHLTAAQIKWTATQRVGVAMLSKRISNFYDKGAPSDPFPKGI